VVNSIVATRQEDGGYASFADFLDKSQIAVCNKRVVESLIRAGAFDSLGHTRKSLFMVQEQAVDAVIGVKRQEAIGQFDLFSMGEPAADAAAAPRIGLDFKLTAEEWPRKLLLASEREMLGLYVSGHPLDGAERILARNRDTAIADLLASGRSEGDVQVAGIIVSVDRRINKKSGNPWAIVTIEDLDAAVEALFFPKVYSQYAAGLTEDAAICVRGRISDRDGTVSIFAQDLTALDLTAVRSSGGPPVVIAMHDDRVSAELVAELKHILQAHPGGTPVVLRMERAGDSPVLMECDFPVQPSSSFMADIKSLLGATAIAAA
jgi:DNA polymerase-3 subunit alpha